MVSHRAFRAAFLITFFPAHTYAHHSFAVFDLDRTIELRGVVVNFNLRSPHSSFVVDGRVFMDGALRDDGVERWEIESDALAVLRTIGIDAQTFKPGDAITITAAPHRDPAFKFAHAFMIVTADGTQYHRGASNRVFSPSLRPPLPGAATGNAGPELGPAVPSETRGIERLAGRWQQPYHDFVNRPVTPSAPDVLPLNTAGKAAQRRYDSKLSPANTCEPMSIPDVFMAPFYLFDVRFEGQGAVLHNETYDIVRAVALNGEPAPADPQGRFGIVSGRIEGDTLIVESRGYPPSEWGLGAAVLLGGGADAPSSEQKVLTERYSVTEDGKTLVLEFTLHDPVYMTEPYNGRVELTRVPDAAQMYAYECDVESASMWSRTSNDEPLRVDDQ